MALVHTPQRLSEFKAPDFSLMGIDDERHTLQNVMGEHGLVVVFICNHCPYVTAIIDRLTQTFNKLMAEGVGCVAIMSNDVQNYPADSFDNMKIFAVEHSFAFPYVIDETQEIAKAYGAVCTPDFFGFNQGAMLKYSGRLDSAGAQPANDDTIPELFHAMMKVKEVQPVEEEQISSMGCSIKWRGSL